MNQDYITTELGYEHLKKIIDNFDVDVFCHCWMLK